MEIILVHIHQVAIGLFGQEVRHTRKRSGDRRTRGSDRGPNHRRVPVKDVAHLQGLPGFSKTNNPPPVAPASRNTAHLVAVTGRTALAEQELCQTGPTDWPRQRAVSASGTTIYNSPYAAADLSRFGQTCQACLFVARKVSDTFDRRFESSFCAPSRWRAISFDQSV